MSRHENSNQFKDGLLMDLHPLQTPNTVLTDNLNGTFITYNGNEYSLQNDMGNFKLRNCRLEPKYFPIGTTSYADTIYIVSYNPIDKLVQIGSYPAPVKYNDNPNGRKEKFYTISEAFILNQYRNNPSPELILNTSDISEYTMSTIFSGDEYRLKGGDEISINYDQLVKCGFEELVSNVIYDSGKKQKVNLKYNTDYDSVPWSTAGNIELTSRIFDIDNCTVFVANEYYTKSTCHVDFQIDLFISDEGLIKKINRQSNIFDNSNKESDYIWIDAPTFTQTKNANEKWALTGSSKTVTATIKHHRTTKYLGEFLKVSFLVSYDFYLKTKGEGEFVIEKFPIVFKPIFNTSISFNSSLESDQSDQSGDTLVIRSAKIVFDSKQFELDHVVDSSKNPFNKVGDKLFKWSFNSDSDEWTISANGSDLLEDVGKMFYKIVCVRDDGGLKTNIESEEWSDEGISWNGTNLTWDIKKTGLDSNEFYYVFYKVLEWSNYEEEPSADSNFIRYEQTSKYIDKSELLNTENRTTKVFLSTMPQDSSADRYDKLSFESFVKTVYLADTLTGTIEKEDEDPSLDADTKEDLENGTKKSLFSKYFSRFDEGSGIDFPSFIKVSEAPSGSEMIYASQKFKYTHGSSETDNPVTATGIFHEWERKLRCDNGFKTVDVGEDNIFKSYFGKKCSLSVGNQFMFVDGLKYYQLKLSPFSGNQKREFYAMTIDKQGKSIDEYYIKAPIYSWNGSGSYWPNYRSVDLGNYRSIRMFYPPNHGDRTSGYNTHGCCQVDFGASAAIGKAAKILEYASIPNLCQYVGNFHINVRSELDEQWNSHGPKTDSNGKIITSDYNGKLNLNGYHASEVMLAAKTFYRDGAQRPSFTNNSYSVNFFPEWDKWTDDRGPAYASTDDMGVQTQRTFIALPLWNTSKYLYKRDESEENPKLKRSIDREDWWKVSSSEQHTIPEILGYEEIDGIGLMDISERPHYGLLNLNVAWVPGNPEAKFEKYAYVAVKFGNDLEKVDFKLFPARKIPETIKNIIGSMKKEYPDLAELPILDITNENVVSGDAREIASGDPIWANIEWDVSKYDNQQTIDRTKLADHEIFKYVSFQVNPDTRIQSSEVAGVYPIREEDQLAASGNSVFEGATGFTNWDKFKVDEEGRVYLTNLDSKDNIYIKKNSNKAIFGYFPYLPYCDSWI